MKQKRVGAANKCRPHRTGAELEDPIPATASQKKEDWNGSLCSPPYRVKPN
jgi:hypothetical protein